MIYELTNKHHGLVTGALNAGEDAEAVLKTLQAEIGRHYHEKKALRSNMLVYVAVGWTTVLLGVDIMVAVNAYVPKLRTTIINPQIDVFSKRPEVPNVD